MHFSRVFIIAVGLYTPALASDFTIAQIDQKIREGDVKLGDQDCWFDVKNGAMDGRRIDCGELIVPEDWDDQQLNEIHLPFVRFRARANEEKGEPLIFLTGGPGQRANLRTDDEIWNRWIEFLRSQPWSDRHDLIVATPRGSNWTDSNLDCPELSDPRIAAGAAGQVSKRRDWRETYWPAFSTCVQRLKHTQDLDGYTNHQATLDVLALTQLLDLEEWSLLGVSYGTNLALEIMRLAPGGLKKVILDSVQPPDLNWIGDIFGNLNQSLLRMQVACAENTNCNKDYEDLEYLLSESVRMLDEDGIYYSARNNSRYGKVYFNVSSSDLFAVITEKLAAPRSLGTIPSMLADFVQNKGTELGNALPKLFDPENGLASGALELRVCNMVADDLPDIDWSGIVDSFPQLRTYIDDSRELFGCSDWPLSEQPASEEKPVVSDIPTLLLAGFFDPLTPPEQAEHAAASLPNSHVFVFGEQSHSVLTSSPCAAVVTTAFLRNPTPRPNVDCSLLEPKIVFKSRSSLD